MAVKISEEISLQSAYTIARRNRANYRWPRLRDGSMARLEPDYDPILRPRFALNPASKIFTVGSCFARNIEARLGELGFDVPMMGLSVPPAEYSPAASIADKFTPPSALQELERTFRMIQSSDRIDEISDEVLLPIEDGRVIDLELREYVPVTRQRAYERRRHIFDVFRQAFDADCVVITLGLVECWFDRVTGRAIQETPRSMQMLRAGDRFSLRILSINEVVDSLDSLVRLLTANGRQGKKILLTVSPVPLEATFSGLDVVVANAYSKSTLRTAAQIILDRFDEVDYFPSYEMVTMARSADVWKSDRIHVTEAFVEKVVDVLVRDYVRPTTVPPSMDGGDSASEDIAMLGPNFGREGTFGWTVRLPVEFAELTDTDDAPERSPLLLYEAGRELGPGHEQHALVRELGRGCYSFWKDTLYFSTSDGSDPNINGRAYTVCRLGRR